MSLAELNFILIPLPSVSHIIPFTDMAILLAQRGVTVTLLLTPLNAARFTAVVDRAIDSGLLIRVAVLRFPAKEVGLPEGCENQNDVPGLLHRRKFMAAIDMLQDQAENLLEEMKPTPSCIISDTFVAWTAETADKLKIPRINFDGMSCFTQVCRRNLYIIKEQNRIPESGHFVIPDLPDRIEVTKAQLPAAFNPGTTLCVGDIRDKMRAAEERAYGVVINTFEELEQRYVDKFRKQKDGRVWCIGPLSLCNNNNLDKAQRGNKALLDEYFLKWLDSCQPESVVYVCFGSLGYMTLSQFTELALGLEASGYPFILVLKPGEGQAAIDKWLQENGFEQRINEKGLLIRGWAPQLLILSHPATGGFLTHCGWNSTLEGITAGVPMITWPLFAEQFLNERFLEHVSKTSAGVGSQRVVSLGEEHMFEVQVSNEQVANAIRKVMDKDDKDSNERRKRARDLAEIAKRAAQADGSSYLNLSLLIQEIQHFQLHQFQPV